MGTGAVILGKQLVKCSAIAQPEEKEESHLPWRDYELGTQNIGLLAGLAKAVFIKEQKGLNIARQKDIRGMIRQELSKIEDFNIVEWDGPHSPGILSWTCINEQTKKQLQSKTLDISWKTFPLSQHPKQTGMRLSWSDNTSDTDLDYLRTILRSFRSLT